MIAYLIKSTIFLLLLLLVYHVFLEREKMHRFNRYFLILGLIFSFTVPLLTVPIGTSSNAELQILNHVDQINERVKGYQDMEIPQATDGKEMIASDVDSSTFYSSILFLIYILIATVLAVRLFYNLYALFKKMHTHPKEKFGSMTLILVENCPNPHSFLKFIFVDKQAYQSNHIDQTVLIHEQAHVKQKHSIDILFIELIKVAFWFNPVLYFYKKAMQLNHEYLADEAVVADFEDVHRYQKLLLEMRTANKNLSLTSSIQYPITKNRIIMMTKKTSRLKSLCKQLALIPVLAVLVFAFSSRHAVAQNVEQMSLKELMNTLSKRLESTDSLSPKQYAQLQNIVSKMQVLTKPETPTQDTSISRYNKISKKYSKQIQAYLTINAVPENRDEIKKAHQKLTKSYNKAMKIYQKLKQNGKDINPLAPPPLSPIERIETKKPGDSETALNQIIEAYSNHVQSYVNIVPVKANVDKLKTSYKKVMSLYHEATKLNNKVYNGDSGTLPIPLSPVKRVEAYSKIDITKLTQIRNNYQKSLKTYTQIKPIPVNKENMEVVYGKIVSLHKELKEKSPMPLLKVVPLPLSPTIRIKAQRPISKPSVKVDNTD